MSEVEYTVHCMFCGDVTPCNRVACEGAREVLRNAHKALDASFVANPLPLSLAPDSRGMNQKRWMREASEMLYDMGAP